MTIKDRQDLANEVYNILKVDYPNYSKETIGNLALLELYDNTELNAKQLSDKLKTILILR